jgi:phospholipid transport system substrate-binding protein
VTRFSLTRAAFLASIVGAALVAAAPAAEARRNEAAEQYVQVNANQALRTLSNQSLSAEQRQAEFATLMNRFSNVPDIAGRVLGPYGRQVYADPHLRDAWLDAFRDYMFATYEYRLDRYRGNQITVVDSNEIVPGQRVEVLTTIVPHGQTRPLPVRWRLTRSGTSDWKVIDVSLVLEGGEFWLGEQQRQEFLSFLDRNGRDVQTLIDNVRRLTDTMRQRTMARG